MSEDKNYKSRRRGAVLYSPIAALLIAIVIFFGVSVFFRITQINIQGISKYSEQQILQASGVKTGDNLVFVDARQVASAIKENLPYLSDVQVEKIIPDRIDINISESQPLAAVKCSDTWWIIDQKARVLEKTDEATALKKIQFFGITPTAVTPGTQLQVGDNEKTALTYLTNVLTAIQNAGMSTKVGKIDLSNIGSVKFSYLGRFTVIMGTGENCDYKLVKLKNTIQKLSADDKGKIDVSKDDQTSRFIPN